MIGLIVFCFVILSILVLKNKKKHYLYLIFMYISMAPLIKLNNLVIDSSYLIMLFLVILIFINSKNHIIKLKISKNYFILIFLNFLLYFFSSFINNNFQMDTIKCATGFIKIPLCIFLIFSVFDFKTVKTDFYKYLRISVILNILVCLFQMLTKDSYLEFFKILYSKGNDYYSFVSGKYAYSRTFGLFSSPVFLGNFSLFSLSSFLSNNDEKNKQKLLYIILTVLLGFLSATKTFVFGMIIIFFMLFLINIMVFITEKHIAKRKTMLIVVIFIFLLPLFYFLTSSVINLLANNGVYIKYYLQFISSPFSAFATRYGTSDNLLLAQTYKVIKEHLMIGVGFASLNGEFIGDSTYVSALHNGGIISLITIIVFYLSHLIKNLKFKNKIALLLLTFIISGFGIPSLFNEYFLLPFLCYYFYEDYNSMESERG